MSKQGVVGRGLVICLVYGLLYYGLRYSPSFLNLSAGLSYALLLIVRRRHWWPIAAGQVAATFAALVPKLSEEPYTPTWLACAVLVPICVALGAVSFARHHWSIERLNTVRDMTRLLQSAAVCAVASAVGGLIVFGALTLDLTSLGSNWPKLAGIYSMGTFLGIISIAPLAHWYRQSAPTIRSLTGALHAAVTFVRQRRVELAHIVLWCVPFTALTYVAPGDDVQWFCRIALFGPLLIFVAQGWKAVAMLVPSVNLSLAFTHSTAMREPNLMLLMELSVLLWCMALAWGMRVMHHVDEADRARRERERYKAIAQQRELLPHYQRRHQAAELDRLYSCISEAESELRRPDLDREEALRVWWATIANARQQLRQMRDTVYSPLLDERGLRVALIAGPIALAVIKTGATYHSFVPSDTRRLSKVTQETVYHAVHEAAFQLLSMGTPKRMRVSVRTGFAAGRRWVAVKVWAELYAIPVEDGATIPSSNRISDLGKVARAYGGDCKQRRVGDAHTVAILIFDDAQDFALGAPVPRKAAG